MRHASLFSGIGGFDLAAQDMGWENIFQVEIDDFATKVLEQNFPKVKRYTDIYDLNATIYEKQIDIISGGFPCQPFSQAGKREGSRDNRFLWPQMLRIIQECKPPWVVAENVYGILNIEEGMVFQQVCLDLEAQGYEVQPFIIPACGKGARHRRDRVWFIGYNVGYAQHNGLSAEPIGGGLQYQPKASSRKKSVRKSARASSPSQDVAHTKGQRCEPLPQGTEELLSSEGSELLCRGSDGLYRGYWEVEPSVGRVANGIPHRVDRLKALGNAIVPQIAYDIFLTIKEMHDAQSKNTLQSKRK